MTLRQDVNQLRSIEKKRPDFLYLASWRFAFCALDVFSYYLRSSVMIGGASGSYPLDAYIESHYIDYT
jgi:hypothetical protein